MPNKLHLDRRIWAIIILLVALALNLDFHDLVTPFWRMEQQNPLLMASTCAEQFASRLEGVERIGYFYQQPQSSTFFADKRSTPQLQMQYVLAPSILDSRPEVVAESRWVIGYFENEKLAENEAQTLAPILGLQVESACRNFVLFRRAG
jgi:hypothetical protein